MRSLINREINVLDYYLFVISDPQLLFHENMKLGILQGFSDCVYLKVLCNLHALDESLQL